MKKNLFKIMNEGFFRVHELGSYYTILEKKYSRGYRQRLLYDITNDAEITRWTLTPSDSDKENNHD